MDIEALYQNGINFCYPWEVQCEQRERGIAGEGARQCCLNKFVITHSNWHIAGVFGGIHIRHL